MKKYFLAALITIVAFSGSMAMPINHSFASNNECFYQAKKKSTKKPHKKLPAKKKSTPVKK